jgi:hypothetical protein
MTWRSQQDSSKLSLWTSVARFVIGCLAFIACADAATVTNPSVETPSPIPPIAGVVVSDAVPFTTASDALHAVAGSLYAYVSLPPGAVSNGISITISNRRNGERVTTDLEEGGLDPVAIAAETGDTLDIVIARLDGSTIRGEEVVNPRRPPIIVRTVPPRGKRDVPLNTRILVVFNEPMDATSLASGAVQLQLDGASVPGSLAFSEPDGTAITFTPASDLESARMYTVVVTTNVRDLDGQPLEREWVTAFATAAVNTPSMQLTSTRVGDMMEPRWGHTATLLEDGRVLITGGGDGLGSATAELYDPATRTFAQTGSMLQPRRGHHAVLLNDGQVLIVGGTRAELYDPVTGTFREADRLRPEPQYLLSATRLHSGEVLVVGRYYASLYNPATGHFRDAGPYAFEFYSYEAVTLQDGRVLLAGDIVSQIYDPSTDTFRRGGETGYVVELQTLTVLPDGRVLMAGGMEMRFYDRAVLYDPFTDSFQPTGNMNHTRDAHAAAVLRDGRVLIVGGGGSTCYSSGSVSGCTFSGSLTSVEVYDPRSGKFELGPEMRFPRASLRATRLQNGDVLITGGSNFCGIGCYLGPLASAELYQLAPLPARQRH